MERTPNRGWGIPTNGPRDITQETGTTHVDADKTVLMHLPGPRQAHALPSHAEPYFTGVHRISWWGVAGGERVPRTGSMNTRGWGFDATCTCGWDSRTGGAIAPRIKEAVAAHRLNASLDIDDRAPQDRQPREVTSA